MIGRQDCDIARLHLAMNFRQTLIERLQRGRIACNIAAVAVIHVEIDEVGEDEIAVQSLIHGFERRLHQGIVTIGLDHPRHALMRIDIADLADCQDLAVPLDKAVKKRRLRRQNRKVAPVARSSKCRRTLPDEGACDDAADIQRIEDLADDLAQRNQPLQPEMHLVRRNLEDRVRRRVADRLARADMLFAKTGDDVRAGRMTISKDAREVALLADRIDKLRREGIALGREITPLEAHRRSGNFPMTGGRILALRDFVGAAMQTENVFRGRHASRAGSAGKRRDLQRPSADMLGSFNGPDLRPALSAAPAAQNSAMWPSVLEPKSP